ncbi:hypothetical protein COB55_05460 [Candidatus Wolfebacteria bacterium]|nr:MAG: hypothetical protein COB55_05460 [Candidatus Wolfebacteria bacterium]
MKSKSHIKHVAKKLHDAFPPPRFLQLPAVGLDISDHSIRFVELIPKRDGFRLVRFAHKRLPDAIFTNGEIRDLPGLKKALSDFQKENDIGFIHASLPEEKAYLYKTDVSTTEPAEIRSAIEFGLEENVPLSPAEAVFDFHILNRNDHESLDHTHASVTVLPKKVINQYIDLFSESNLNPLSFEIEAQSIARAVVADDNKDTVMVVDFGAQRTGISIVTCGVVTFTSTVDIGGQTLTQVIKKYFNVSHEEAEKIKIERGIVRDKTNTELFDLLLSTLATLKDEINKHHSYWNDRVKLDKENDGGEAINRIILCGRDSTLHGLAEYMSANLKSSVGVANVWVNTFDVAEYIPPISAKESLGFATAVGLALKGYRYHA